MTNAYLLSCDLDGTFVFDGHIRPRDAQAVADWRAQGYLTTCNSGRSIMAARHILDTEPLHFDYHILYSGAVVADADYNILYKKALPQDTGLEIAQWLLSMEDLHIFATTINSRDAFLIGPHTKEYTGHISLNPHTTTLNDIQDQEIMGIPIHAGLPEEGIEALYEEILQRYGDEVDVYRNLSFIDIAPKGCSKGTGLQWLLEHIKSTGKTISETHTLGDSWNDIPMHKISDHSCSFEHSPADVQAITEYVMEDPASYIYSVLQSQ